MKINKFILALAVSLAFLPVLAFAADLDIGTILTTLNSVKQPEVIAFALFAVAGVLVHVEMDIKKGIIVAPDGGGWLATLFNYMFKQKIMSSLYMFIGAIGAGAAYFAITPQPINWLQLALAGAMAGYTSDSLFNRAG